MVELEQQKDSFIQVAHGNPSSKSLPINYDTIILNQYNPLNESLSLNNSVSTNINPKNDVLEGDNSTEFDFDSSVHAIDDHY